MWSRYVKIAFKNLKKEISFYKKMITNTQNRKRMLYGVVLFVLCAFILVLTAQTAKASNAYFNNITYYSDSEGFNHIKFTVSTTFIGYWKQVSNVCYLANWDNTQTTNIYGFDFPGFTTRPLIDYNAIDTSICQNFTYTAGYTYDFYMSDYTDATNFKYTIGQNKTALKSVFYDDVRTSSDYIQFREWTSTYSEWKIYDTEKYYFTEMPTLTITYPENNAEIAGPFNIVGSYTIPEASGYTQLWAYLREETIFYLNWFIQDLATSTGAVDIRVSGIPLGDDYNFIFFFKGGGESPYDSGITLNIKILADIPYELPYTGETPPESFNPLDPDLFYTENSNYATPTPLYTNLTGSLKAIVFTLGDNLTFFSSQFTQENAKNTGEKIGDGVLLVRSYAGNLNSFFADLPISEVLFLYMILLVIVSVFRLIRQLIMLIKPL